uniref:Putative secreted protein n=1 Tax=Ixodes scapularis TaxID=6945 RepID=A0A4D5S5P7_IXOSC
MVSYTMLIFLRFSLVRHRVETVRCYLGWTYSLCPTTGGYSTMCHMKLTSRRYIYYEDRLYVSKYCIMVFEGGAYFCRY